MKLTAAANFGRIFKIFFFSLTKRLVWSMGFCMLDRGVLSLYRLGHC
ncbi:hypothetical protein Lalb_Chr08g0246291 [Lupinus albus]|uniref:Uncharacterized protein n=1 Tax=Lupinus albus TaxID=3870 RepID=A0A6A4Q6H7_LUPAL|nr:hypothetical protein Lalb_Chr08g0246291 [Lupinus albus]